MDLFEFDFFRDWELEQQCHFEQERSALKKREWERRTQEVQQDEDLFSSGFNLFGEPYKTNKGDALANRVQNTLGNYDEMKELITNHSNQSHLVGIPKNSVPQTPLEKKDEPSFFPEGQKGRTTPCHQNTSQPESCLPPPPASLLSGPVLLHQGARKPRSADWTRSNHNSTSTLLGPPGDRGKHGSSSHDLPHGRSKDQFSGQVDANPVGASSLPRRHPPVPKPPSSSFENVHKEGSRCTSPVEPDPVSHSTSSPAPSTSLPATGAPTPTFPPGLHSKPIAIQQKPTAYVRPMDGQDQVPNDSPELKPRPEIGDSCDSSALGSLMEGKGGSSNTRSKLPKLGLPQPGEVGLSNDASCVEEILREMTHSWPPPLTAIHTPGTAEQTKFPIPSKDSQHITSGYNGQKRCNVSSNKPATKSVPQKSMLEDDLKLSSDEEDSEQAPEKTEQGSDPLSPSGPAVRNTESGRSSGASASSSESESSSESDSDSESSSSDSECNEASRGASPEPEPPSTNKWQLDKWLNKVNPHSKALMCTLSDSHAISHSLPADSQGEETHGPDKGKPSGAPSQPEAEEGALLSSGRERGKPRTVQKASESKGTKMRSPHMVDQTLPRRTTGKKQPPKVESGPSREEASWPKPANPSSVPKEKEPPPLERPKSRGKGASGKTAPRKEVRPASAPTPASDRKKHRGPSKIVPKSREFIETESSSSECHSDLEEQAKGPAPCPGPGVASLPRAKDCSSHTSTSSASVPDPGAADLPGDSLSSPIPATHSLPFRDLVNIKSLWVKLELSFLSRIPRRDPPDPPPTKAEPRDSTAKHRKQSPAPTPADKPPKSKRKHKSENSDTASGNKKMRHERMTAILPACVSPRRTQKLTSTKEVSKKQSVKSEEKLPPPAPSPLSTESSHHRGDTEASSTSTCTSTCTLHSSCLLPPCSSSSSSSHKCRNLENRSVALSKAINDDDTECKPSGNFHSSSQSHSDPWPRSQPAALDCLEHRRPKLMFDDVLHSADYYMKEAKRLKHKADALLEKFGKAVNYTDGALSFIECGNAMERDPLEAKSPYTMYSETVELIRYALRLKNFTSHSATVAERKLAVLCYRCLSLLYLRMFRLKKGHALKYSRSLIEYFKHSAKNSQATSPRGTNGRSTGTPSPLSPSPSPGSSAHSGGGPGGSSSSNGSVTIPQRIHHMAASHVNITSNVLRSYEHWDTADKLSREGQEFFQELNSVMDPLTQNSSMTELVRYVRQGLHWLRIEAQLL